MSYVFLLLLDGRMQLGNELLRFARAKERFIVGRNKSVFVMAAVMLTILVAYVSPAVAEPSTDPLIFFAVPGGPGGTYSCTGGPPFVSELGSGQENCTLLQTGAPTGLVCDIPTTVTFVPTDPEAPEVVSQYAAHGWLCH